MFPSSQVLCRPGVIKYMKYLREGFVIVPVDKVTYNCDIVCKKFYLQVINQ